MYKFFYACADNSKSSLKWAKRSCHIDCNNNYNNDNATNENDYQYNIEVDSSMSDYFAESGYKFILAVGLLLHDNARLKTVCAERGGIEIVLECLKQRKRSSSVCKWSLWALMVSECFSVITLALALCLSLFLSLSLLHYSSFSYSQNFITSFINPSSSHLCFIFIFPTPSNFDLIHHLHGQWVLLALIYVSVCTLKGHPLSLATPYMELKHEKVSPEVYTPLGCNLSYTEQKCLLRYSSPLIEFKFMIQLHTVYNITICYYFRIIISVEFMLGTPTE